MLCQNCKHKLPRRRGNKNHDSRLVSHRWSPWRSAFHSTPSVSSWLANSI